MKYTTLLYLGAIGSILALIGGLGSQSMATSAGLGSANISSVFISGGNTSEMAEKLSETLPDIREGVERGLPYAGLQFVGYILFATGFIAIWRLTKRGLALAAFLCFALFGPVVLASYVTLPSAMEGLVKVLESVEGDEGLNFFPTSLLILAMAGLLSVVLQLGGSVSGGYEVYRIGKEFDHDLFRGSGVLLMASAVAVFIPFFGSYIMYTAIGVTGFCFYLLASRVSSTLGQNT